MSSIAISSSVESSVTDFFNPSTVVFGLLVACGLYYSLDAMLGATAAEPDRFIWGASLLMVTAIIAGAGMSQDRNSKA